jgi:tRNA1Val (adenine37-N6)-methyltransferase
MLIGDPDVFTLGTDAVLLADFASVKRYKTMLDLGTGSGIIPLIMGWNDPSLKIVAVEVQEKSSELARRNMSVNGLENRAAIVTADLRRWREPRLAGFFDLAVANPPYFPVSSGKSSDNPNIAIAREEIMCTLEDVCRAAAWYVKWGGSFCMVHRPERLAEVMHIMSTYGLEPKRLRLVSGRLGQVPNLILIEGRRGAAPGLTIMPPLAMYDSDGNETDEVKRIYRR